MSPATVSAAIPGFYGKLPARGDFVSRNLSPAFLTPWNNWLQAAITCSRQQLGQDWLNCYLTSPLWRFALSPGVCGPEVHAGVLMPSVDRVGRYYPLVIAAPLPNHLNLLELTWEDWFERAEQVALTGLDEHLDVEDFVGRVQALELPTTSIFLDGTVIAEASGMAWYCLLDNLTALKQVGNGLAGYLLAERFPHYSLWWSHGSEQISPCLLICQALPPPDGFAALLAGNWKQWGWNERPLRQVCL